MKKNKKLVTASEKRILLEAQKILVKLHNKHAELDDIASESVYNYDNKTLSDASANLDNYMSNLNECVGDIIEFQHLPYGYCPVIIC